MVVIIGLSVGWSSVSLKNIAKKKANPQFLDTPIYIYISFDWFKGENLNRKPTLLPLNMGFPVIFPLNQSNEVKNG